MADRKLSLEEVVQALEDDGIIYNTSIYYYIEPGGIKIILEKPRIVMGRDGSVTFSKGHNTIEKFVGVDTEDEHGEEVFKDIFVIEKGAKRKGSRRKGRKY
jgi:hypothetical protein